MRPSPWMSYLTSSNPHRLTTRFGPRSQNPDAPNMNLILGCPPSSSNPSYAMFYLSSLLSISKERVESLGDEELMLVASQFMWFHNNHVNRWLSGGKEGCFHCGDSEHFITNFSKMKGKQEVGNLSTTLVGTTLHCRLTRGLREHVNQHIFFKCHRCFTRHHTRQGTQRASKMHTSTLTSIRLIQCVHWIIDTQ